MNIALVAPSPVPFTFGGTESLVIEIQRIINSNTSHKCETIKIPTRENTFWQLIESYYAFYTLDLSHFDAVISTKYPSWMVNHQFHYLYLIHPFRQVYDMYLNYAQPYDIHGFERYELVQDILEIIQSGDQKVNEVFDLLFAIRDKKANYHEDLFRVPGPFLRSIIHYFDHYALDPSNIKKYYAISERVKRREGYFSKDVPVKVLYPPSCQRPCLEPAQSNKYALSVSRLVNTKRVNLIIEAMEYVNPDIHLKIVGEGPEEKNLRKIAKKDQRVEFIGFVKDEELKKIYSSAFALVFVPKDEEYGLVILEAMQCHKPVITALDSGGPLELVKDGINGFVVPPDPKEIAEKIMFLYRNPQITTEMGRMGKELVNIINQEFLNEIETELKHLKDLIQKKRSILRHFSF